MSYPGGIGRVTAIKANYFADKGHNVTILTEIQGNAPSYYELNDTIKHYDIGLGLISNKILKVVLRVNRLRRILENVRPDIVIYTCFMLPIHCNFKYKSILECHFNHDAAILRAKAFNTSIFKAKVLIHYYEYVASKVDVLVVLTDQDKEMWEKVLKKSKICVINNMNSLKVDKRSSLSCKNVIAVGRLDAQKSFDRLIVIWSKVFFNHKDWQLNIYGKGPDRKMLKALIKKYRLDNSVTINDPVKDIKEKYMQSSIFCFTSTYEGWGLVLTEAMSCGIPVVSYDIPCGPRDIIQNKYNGFLVKDGDIEGFVKSLTFLMDNKSVRDIMGTNAQESTKKYNIDLIMAQWNNLLVELQ